MTNAMREMRRIETILSRDNIKNPSRIAETIKKELIVFLNNFFEICQDSVSVSISGINNADIDFVIKGKANRIYNIF